MEFIFNNKESYTLDELNDILKQHANFTKKALSIENKPKLEKLAKYEADEKRTEWTKTANETLKASNIKEDFFNDALKIMGIDENTDEKEFKDTLAEFSKNKKYSNFIENKNQPIGTSEAATRFTETETSTSDIPKKIIYT